MSADNTFLYGAHQRANGIRQHYLRFGGSGMPLVLVPGITSPAAMWGFVARRLGRHYDTYVMDVRGRGLSESGAHLDYGLDACAADVAGFAAAMKFDRFVLMGHSMGARIILRAARHAAMPLEHLVLLDPPVSGPGRRPYPMPLQPYLDLLRHAEQGNAYDVLQGKTSWPEELVRLRAEWVHTCDERAIVETHRSFHEDDVHADLPHIRCPTALMVASRGDVIRSEDETEIQRLLPGIAIARVPDAGHMIPFENYDGFFTALGDLLKKAI
ncbi:alpha/beta hydrolase [Ferrovibrio sp.]|uniref:alpha/beta fold hydrolase n=1 Tax=Ferrovibrio sp. TaxID=1917215 RepID=UPI0025BB9AAC|nr:alpha/beta hydrolase [Ferrovibrio sp.]MBX3453722.1 alpha/beta hydrolase [Ferrovibrio sp.]